MVVGAEQVDVEVESLDELLAEVGVEADGDAVGDLGDDDEGAVEQSDDVLVLLLVAVLLHLLPHGVVEEDHLVGQVVEEHEGALQRLHLHGVLAVHLGLKPSDELLHSQAQHYIVILARIMENILISFAVIFIGRYIYCRALGNSEVIDSLVSTNRDLEESISTLGKIVCEFKLIN
jgi:hypothetical protein